MTHSMTNKIDCLKYIFFNDHSGYGIAARQYIAGLEAANIKISKAPLRSGNRWSLGSEPDQSRGWDEKCSHLLIHTVPEYYPYILAASNLKSVKKFCYTVWETTHIPPHWPELINQMDGLMVPTHWNKELFSAQGITIPIHVIPHIGQTNGAPISPEKLGTAHCHLQQLLQEVHDYFKFYSIGMWIPRKGMDLLLDAFSKAFTKKDRVALILKTSTSDFGRHTSRLKFWSHSKFEPINNTLKRYHARYPQSAPVLSLTDDWGDDHIHALHEMGDIFVNPARAEGWGLGAWEAAWLGRPIIVNRFSGFSELLPPDYPGFFSSTLCQVPNNDPWRPKKDYFYQQWGEPSSKEMVQRMRDSFANPQNHRSAAEHFKQFLTLNYSRGKIIQQLIGFISQ